MNVMGFRTDIEAVVLAALQEGPLHGYGIVRALRNQSEGILKMGEGQLYPVLHRMEEAGLVQGDWEMQEGKPPKKRYALTETGVAALEHHRKQWSAFSKAVGKVMANSDSTPAATGQAHPFGKEAKGHA